MRPYSSPSPWFYSFFLKRSFYFLIFALSFFSFRSAPALALDQPFDHSAWDQFLKQFVNDKGEVNYQAAQKNPALLDDYLKQLSKINFREFFTNWPREEKLAVWLNAYHAGITQIILEHYPIKSINDIPGVWDLPIVKIGGQTFSLNQIRSRELIKVFRDEKIHFALSCAAESCPQLRREAFTGPRMEGQLFLAAREFVNNSQYNQITPGKKAILISHLFEWYAIDFTLDFGSPENDDKLSPQELAVLSFIAHYLEDAEKLEYLEEGNYKIKYLPFDWNLNDWRG